MLRNTFCSRWKYTILFFSNMTSLLFFFLEAHFWVTFHFNLIFRLREIVPSGLENFAGLLIKSNNCNQRSNPNTKAFYSLT